MPTFVDLVTQVRARAAGGDVPGALSTLRDERTTYPRQLGQSFLLEAELLAANGRGAEALAPLEEALALGCRYKKEWLLGSKGLASFTDDPAFRSLVERAQRAWDEAAAAAKPHLMFAMPDTLPDAFGYPLLMVLHGNNSTAKRTAERWSGMADSGWVVATPQSSEIGATPDTFTWNDRERVATELDIHFDKVKRATEIDTSRIVLGGYSMGGAQALALALSRRFVVRGVVVHAPWLPKIDELAALVEGGAGKVLRIYIVVGDRDPSVANARDLVAIMQAKGMRATLDERAGLDHDYPEDMDATLARALDFVTK